MENPSVDDFMWFKNVEKENGIDRIVADKVAEAFDYSVDFTYKTVWQNIPKGPLGFFGNKIQFFRDIEYVKDDDGGILKYTKISASIKNESTDKLYRVALFETMLGKNYGFAIRNLNAVDNDGDRVVSFRKVIYKNELKV